MQDEEYTLFIGNNNWYLFLRLHQILCDRLAKMSEKSAKIAEEEAQYSANRKESTAVALRLKPNGNPFFKKILYQIIFKQ
jgi:paired amphipathic helix protein Sin3a